MKTILLTLAASLLFAPAALAQESAADGELFETGQDLFESNCAQCHQPDGSGSPPTFPALDGNGELQDLELIVSRINQGEGAMPPFPTLGTEDITALATYIRNAWSNEFGAVELTDVEAILGSAGGSAETVSSWSGVFTEEQAERGGSIYSGACALCHGDRLDGAAADPDQPSGPPLARYTFLREWDGQTLSSLYQYSRETMPQLNPGSLEDQEYVDIIAHMLSVSGMPAGDNELTPEPEALSRIVIDQEEP